MPCWRAKLRGNTLILVYNNYCIVQYCIVISILLKKNLSYNISQSIIDTELPNIRE